MLQSPPVSLLKKLVQEHRLRPPEKSEGEGGKGGGCIEGDEREGERESVIGSVYIGSSYYSTLQYTTVY